MKFYSFILAGLIALLPFTFVKAADVQLAASTADKSAALLGDDLGRAAAASDVGRAFSAKSEAASADNLGRAFAAKSEATSADNLGRALASAKLARATSLRGDALPVTEPESFVLRARPGLSPVNLVAQGQEFPSRQAYEAIAALVDDGAISNTTNLDVHQFTYTKAEVLPLVYQAVHKREQMNESDYMRTIMLYREFRQELATYEDVPVPRHYLTKEELAQKMENFHIDYSALGR